MAQIVSNEKGFKVIHVETLDMWAIGSPTKCDYCTADMATPPRRRLLHRRAE